MRKYLVKNCPANPSETAACYGWCNKEQKRCQDVDACIIKQIVHKCIYQTHIPEVDELKEEILKLLEIGEIYIKTY